MEDFMTVEEAAQFLSVSKMTIWRWRNAGFFAWYKIGKGVRFRKRDLQAFVERGRVSAKSVEA